MTTTEIRKKISESESAEWFNNVEVTISYPNINFSQNIKGFSAIHKFFSQQIKGWEKYENIPNEFVQSKTHFATRKNGLENFLNSRYNQAEQDLNSYWNNEITQIQSNSNYFTYDSPHSKFLIDVYYSLPNSFLGAYYFIIGQHRTNNKNEFIGALLAYEFETKDHTELLNRRNKEKSSISNIRNDLREQLSESETQLTQHLTNANKEYEKYVKSIDGFKLEKEDLFTNWFGKSKGDFDNFDSTSKDKIVELERTYREKLKLEAPARYWQVKSAKYYEEGKKARNILLWMVSLTGIFLAIILVVSPDWIFKQVFSENTSSIVRWSVVFIVLLSFIAFAVRAITKVMFSSYHLARDAEERHTLTFFYLALLKDTEVKEEERKLILQSLFSRVDTGLLKEDSGPTMPNDISKIIGK